MIAISEIDTAHTTSWCVACINKCGNTDMMICDTCHGYVKTSHICPVCGLEETYYGHDCPELCKCGYNWPDLNFLKEEQRSRIGYHLESTYD